MKTRRLNRISTELAVEIRRYVASHQEQNAHNLQKKATFTKILTHIESNTLSAETLADILAELSFEENSNLFYQGGIFSGPNPECGAAVNIGLLFYELASYKPGYVNLRNIVNGKMCASNEKNEQDVKKRLSTIIKNYAFTSIIKGWQTNPFDEIKRNHLDHELKWKTFRIDQENFRDQLSLAQTIYDKYPKLTKDNCDDFINDLRRVQFHCPQYMSEFLTELRLHYVEPYAYQQYLKVIANVIRNPDNNQQALVQSLLNSHHELITDVIRDFPEIFFTLDSAMQAKAHQNLLLEYPEQPENEQALKKIYKTALIEIGVQPKEKIRENKRITVSMLDSFSSSSLSSSSEDISESEAELEVENNKHIEGLSSKKEMINLLYSKIKEEAEKIIDKRNMEAARARIEKYLATKTEGVRYEPDKTKRFVFEELLKNMDTFGEPNKPVRLTKEWLQKFLALIFKQEGISKEIFSTGYFSGEENSGAAQCFADLYRIASGRKLTSEEKKKMVQGELPEETQKKRKETLEKTLDERENGIGKFAARLSEDIKDTETKEKCVKIVKSTQFSDVIIKKYLGTTDYTKGDIAKRNPIKIKFFKKLGKRISIVGLVGLTPTVITDFLSKKFPWLSGRKKLFEKKYIGTIEKSGAANCLASLHGEVSGKEMTHKEIKTMVWTGKFPEGNLLKREIEKYVENPSIVISKGNELGGLIASAYKKLHDVKAVLQRTKIAGNIAVETAYQQKLIDDGIAWAMIDDNRLSLRFDLQGHIILDFPIEDRNVFCSLDIKNNGPLADAFVDWMIDDVSSRDERDALRNAIFALWSLPSRSSIIPLQEEMEMRMRYIARAMEKSLPQLDWKSIRSESAHLINLIVKKEFQKILQMESVFRENAINNAELNRKLDEAREILMPAIQQKLLEVVNIEINRNRQAFSPITATGMEYLRTDVDNQSCIRISDVNKEGKARVLHQSVYRNKTVYPSDKAGLELNVPSTAIKDLSHNDAMEEVANKLRDHYNFFNRAGHEGPMIFNLTTSLHSKFKDVMPLFGDRENRQRKNTARILKGAHLFNQDQVFAGRTENLLYVQNMDVSQHGERIKYDSYNGAISEAALMNEVAMLSCFASHAAILPPRMRHRILDDYHNAHAQYVGFLQTQQQQMGEIYFNNDPQNRGHQVHSDIAELKKYMKKNAKAFNADPHAPLNELAIKTLMKLVSMDKHLKSCYGSLVQSLSVFVEQASQTGCEGMKGRDEMVLKRVDLLQTVSHLQRARVKVEDDRRLEIVSVMLSFLNHDDNDKQNLKKIVETLNEVLNQYNVYGATVNLGHETHGASNDIEASETSRVMSMEFNTAKIGKLGFFDRKVTIAEPQQLTNLQQKHAMQKENQSEGWTHAFEKIKMQRGI